MTMYKIDKQTHQKILAALEAKEHIPPVHFMVAIEGALVFLSGCMLSRNIPSARLLGL